MKHKKLIIVILVILLIGVIAAFYLKSKSPKSFDFESMREQMQDMGFGKQEQEQEITLTQKGEIKSAVTENIEPHAGYYLEEICVEEKQFVAKGENIIKYTNGKYFVAPYDCIITELNLPELEGKCLNSNYIQIESTNILTVSMKIDEEQINKMKIGTEAKIEVGAVEKTYTGYVTNISSIASNGRFEITIEFENDGNTKVGMTSNIEMKI